jgi:hypothetical protein
VSAKNNKEKEKSFMNNTGTLILALREKKRDFGDEVGARFGDMCLKPFDPSMLSLQYWIQDQSGEKYIKPQMADGQDNPYWKEDPPRDAEERGQWFQKLKCTIEKDWEDRIRNGEFDEVGAPISQDRQSNEHVDVTKMDIEEDEPVEESEPEGVEIVKETLAEMPETEVVDDVEELERKLESERIANLRVKFEEQQLENIDKLAESQEEEQDGDMLLTHLGLFVRKHIPETKNHQHMRMMSDSITELEKKVERLSNRCDAAASVIKAQQAAIKDISKLVPEMIKEEILKKFA